MSFFRRLFGGEKESAKGEYQDPDGIYLYVECDRCHTCVRVRADKRHDLNATDNGYEWHKTIVDSRCFQRMSTVVQFDRNYNIVSSEIDRGHYITEAAYNDFVAQTTPPASDKRKPDAEDEHVE